MPLVPNLSPPQPNVLARMQAKLARMVFGQSAGPWLSSTGGGMQNGAGFLSAAPGAELDYNAIAGDLWRNPATMACIAWMQRAFPQAKLQVTQEDSDGAEKPIPRHPMVELCERPNPYYSGRLLWQATLLSYVVAGNAYWIKAKGSGGFGRTRELWWVPHWQIWPEYPRDGSEFLTGYTYKPNAGQVGIHLEPNEVVHFRFGLDPLNIHFGMSPLATAGTREVATDNEATTYAAAILRNKGVIGGMLTPADPSVIVTEDDVPGLAAGFQQSFTGENRAKLWINAQMMNFTELGTTPEKMALSSLRDVPEARICALLGLSTMVVGLPGGAREKTYANYESALQAAYQNNIIPTGLLFSDELALQLLPDFTAGGRAGERGALAAPLGVQWDYSKVLAMQPDQNKVSARAVDEYEAGLVTKNEARAAIGKPPVTDGTGDTYFDPMTQIPRGARTARGTLLQGSANGAGLLE